MCPQLRADSFAYRFRIHDAQAVIGYCQRVGLFELCL